MYNCFGEKITFELSGESHGEYVAVAVRGLPKGEPIDTDELASYMAKRAPGKSGLVSRRKESDVPIIESGLSGGATDGNTLYIKFPNTDISRARYTEGTVPRPSHADYPAYVKYGSIPDGGSVFSGRMTAPLCAAGNVCAQILRRRGIEIGAHILSVGNAYDTRFDAVGLTAETLSELRRSGLPVIDAGAREKIIFEIERAALGGDSVGGSVECAALGLPAGIGEPLFGSVESRVSAAVFAVPAVKSVSFGLGEDFASAFGSSSNDGYRYDNGKIRTVSNNCGGICGGLTTGMPLIFKAVFKPTPSISLPQRSVDLSSGEEVTVSVRGRHDPCVALRGVYALESALACVLLDILL